MKVGIIAEENKFKFSDSDDEEIIEAEESCYALSIEERLFVEIMPGSHSYAAKAMFGGPSKNKK